MSQPPLSQAIRKLEDELGVQLLQRTSRTVSTTEAGRVFAEHARELIADFNSAIAAARSSGDATQVVRIGCSPYLPTEQLRVFLDALHAAKPNLQTQVTELLALAQVRCLRSGELDLGILPHPGEIEVEGIELEPLVHGEPIAVFLPAGHPLTEKAVVAPEDVSGEALVVIPRALNRDYVDHYIQRAERAGYRFASVIEAGGGTPRELLFAVAGGFGITFQRSSFEKVSGAKDVVVQRPLAAPLTLPEEVVAWRSNPPRHLRPVIDAVRHVARELRSAEPGAEAH
jgi:DNA-binding transcriptional LysR family regulator